MSRVEPFFPFRIYSNDQGHNIYGFGHILQANRPEYIEIIEAKGTKFEWTRREKFSYYAFDIIFLSQTEIEFVFFDMYDNYYGGKGKEIHRLKVTVDKSVTNDYVGRRLFNRGVARRERELAEAERKICQAYARDEAAAIGIKFKD